MLKIEDHSRSLAGGNKLAPRFEGPFVVDEVKANGNALKIRDPNDPTRSRANKTVSIKNAKRFNARDEPPTQAAAKQKDRLDLLPDSPSTDSDSTSTPASPEEASATPTTVRGPAASPGLHPAPFPATCPAEVPLPSSLPPPAASPVPATPISRQDPPGPAQLGSPAAWQQIHPQPLRDPAVPSLRVQGPNPPPLGQADMPVAAVQDSAPRLVVPPTLPVSGVPAAPGDALDNPPAPPTRPTHPPVSGVPAAPGNARDNPPALPALSSPPAPRASPPSMATRPAATGRVTRSTAQAKQGLAPSDSPPALRRGPRPPAPSPSIPLRGALLSPARARDKKSKKEDDEPLPAPVVQFINGLEPLRASIRSDRDRHLPHAERTLNEWRRKLREHFKVTLADSALIAALNKGIKEAKDLDALNTMLDLWAQRPEAGPLARMIKSCRPPRVRRVNFVTASTPLVSGAAAPASPPPILDLALTPIQDSETLGHAHGSHRVGATLLLTPPVCGVARRRDSLSGSGGS